MSGPERATAVRGGRVVDAGAPIRRRALIALHKQAQEGHPCVTARAGWRDRAQGRRGVINRRFMVPRSEERGYSPRQPQIWNQTSSAETVPRDRRVVERMMAVARAL